MEIFLNPNIAYMLLAGGLVFAVLALLAPGTGVLEIFGLFILMLAGWSVANIGKPLNAWAMIALALGVVLFVVSVRGKKSGQLPLLAVSILALVIGSAYLFAGESWWLPGVNPVLAAVVSVFSGGFFWLAARKVLEANSLRPAHDLRSLIGATGEAKTNIRDEGTVQVGSELWSAHSKKPLPIGTHVRVIKREGFNLEVEAIDQPDSDQ
jgi:membrane-bound ClpP family serine protease